MEMHPISSNANYAHHSLVFFFNQSRLLSSIFVISSPSSLTRAVGPPLAQRDIRPPALHSPSSPEASSRHLPPTESGLCVHMKCSPPYPSHFPSGQPSLSSHSTTLSSHSASLSPRLASLHCFLAFIPNMTRQHCMRCRRWGGGQGAGSQPPLSIHDTYSFQPSASNEAQFHFNSAMDRLRITATISVVFQAEQHGDFASGSRKRRRKSTISVKPPQDTRKTTALPVKSSTQTSSSEGIGNGSSARVDKKLKDNNSSSSSKNCSAFQGR